MIDVDESQLSPGKMLLQGRLLAGLTQEQVAKDLYMTVAKVKALESDDYNRLTSDTFARGYIRAYANLLKLDVVKVLAAYERLVDEATASAVPKTEEPKAAAIEYTHRGAWQFLAVIGAFFLGLWLISVWFFDNHLEPQEMRYVVPPLTNNLPKIDEAQLKQLTQEAANRSAAQASSVGLSADEQPKVASAPNAEKATAASSVAVQISLSGAASSQAKSLDTKPLETAQQDPKVTAMQAANAKTEEGNGAVKKASLDEISFSFRAESWLEVSDSRGDVLATELQAAGSNIKLVGQAPFDVKLGNAPAVNIQLNGKKVDVIPLMGTNVLIMKVGNP